MSKNESNREINDNEIDLLYIFRSIGRTLVKWIKATGTGLLVSIVFLLRNSVTLIFSILIGVLLSYTLKWSSKPFFESEITLRSNSVPNADMIAYINRLDILLKEKNVNGLAGLLSVSTENAASIKEISACWVIDRNRDSIPDFVDYKNNHNVYDTLNLRMKDRFVIKVVTSDLNSFPQIRNGIFFYVKSNTLFKQKNDFRLKETDELLKRLNYDIKQLDSLQKVKYFEETRNLIPEKNGQIVFMQEQKTQLVYPDIYYLYTKKQILDQEKDLYPDIITVMSDFHQPLKRQNGGMYYGRLLIPLCFGLTLILLIYHRNRKKLREIFRKYQ
jgi:hypothetical protein